MTADVPVTPVRRRRTAIQVIAALVVLGAWLVAAAIGGPTFGRLDAVTTNDQASYLPATAESTSVQAEERRFFGADTVPVVVLFVRSAGVAAADRQLVADRASVLSRVAHVRSISAPIPSQDGKALELIGTIDASADAGVVVGAMRHALSAAPSTRLKSWVTGPAAVGADFGAGFAGIDGVLLLVALAAVLLILLVVYRSLLLPVVVLLTSAVALTGCIIVVYAIGAAGLVTITGQSRGILAILAIGAATDYSLLLVSRYREALRATPDHLRALRQAWRRSLEPIAASAATVILGVLCLGFSDLESNKGLGPVSAIAVAFAFLAAMTALPAALALLGRPAFWPLVPRFDASAAALPDPPTSRLWGRIGALVTRRPRALWVGTALLLGVLAVGLTQLQASGVPQTDLLLSPSQSVSGQRELAKHYEAGSGSPVEVTASHAAASAVLATVRDTGHVTEADVFTGDRSPTGAVTGSPKVVDGRVLIEGTLDVQADGTGAQDLVERLRTAVRAADPTARVGGTSALDLDANLTAQQDLRTIVPIVLAVILVILMLLLRAVVAPLILIGTVVLSYAATLGIAAVVFRYGFGFPGADPSVPLFGFVFLVALGVDYNIFLMTRVREESRRRGTRAGTITGLVTTGGVITSAGIVLAATFAALGVIPILFLVQIAFIVASGVLIDTLIVRTLLVPALISDIGRAVWWPSSLARSMVGESDRG